MINPEPLDATMALDPKTKGLGFRELVWGLRLRVYGLGRRLDWVWSCGFRGGASAGTASAGATPSEAKTEAQDLYQEGLMGSCAESELGLLCILKLFASPSSKDFKSRL